MSVWHVLFMIVAYTAMLSCLYAAYKKGITHLFILALFVVLYWFLESWAGLRAPYYYYPPGFPDMRALFDWNSVGWFPGPVPPIDECPPLGTPSEAIPLAVLFLEASLTYSVMRTGELLGARPILLPFLSGLVVLGIDAFLDPVTAVSHLCTDDSLGVPGLGLWKWVVHPKLGLFFGIPLFNYASWYAAPVVLVALVQILDWARRFVTWLQGNRMNIPQPSPIRLIFLLIIFFGFLMIFLLAPTFPMPIWLQITLMLLIVIATLVAVIWFASEYIHYNPFQWELAYPPIAVLVFALLGFLIAGLAIAIPYLWIVAIVSIPLVVWYAVSPYVGGP